jgi:ribosomal protein S18 acetylase RimI-like enzyme
MEGAATPFLAHAANASSASAWAARQIHGPFSIADESGVLASVRVRPISADDLPLLNRIYASARELELAQSGWSDAEKKAFLDQQFHCQHRYYQEHYADAQFMVIERDGIGVGRLYWRAKGAHASLIDISLLPAHRGQGIGHALMTRLTACADRDEQSITLHVEPYNPARRLYRRHDFFEVANNGVYMQMRRLPRPEEA